MITVIFSLGQLISSNLQTLKNAFESDFVKRGVAFNGGDVWEWMKPFLPNLRLGQMTLEDLCHKFNDAFSLTMESAQFTNHFNSMCTMDEASFARVSALSDFLSKHTGIKLVVVSHTNTSHFNYILDQLELVVPRCREGVLHDGMHGEQEANILFATSMFSKCEDHSDTLALALDKLVIDIDQPIISFLNTIQSMDRATQFSYFPADKVLDVNKVMEILSDLHDSPAMTYAF